MGLMAPIGTEWLAYKAHELRALVYRKHSFNLPTPTPRIVTGS